MDEAPPASPELPPARVPLLDTRHQIEAVVVVRGPWAELLGEGALITITHRSEPT
jgi:hypothetical protein